MSSDKLPALQFYPGDWRKDPSVRALKPIDRYVWFEILLVMHESEPRGHFVLNGEPYPLDSFARSINMKVSSVTSCVTNLIQFGVATRLENGILQSRRMVRDENTRQVRKSAGLLGGNPNLLKQKVNQDVNQGVNHRPNQTPTPSFSSSTSLSNSTTVNKKKASLSLADFEIPEMLDNEIGKKALQDWLDYKREKKQGYTQKGFQALLSQKSEWTTLRLRAAVDYSMSSNYSGIFEPSIQNGGNVQRSPNGETIDIPRKESAAEAESRRHMEIVRKYEQMERK